MVVIWGESSVGFQSNSVHICHLFMVELWPERLTLIWLWNWGIVGEGVEMILDQEPAGARFHTVSLQTRSHVFKEASDNRLLKYLPFYLAYKSSEWIFWRRQRKYGRLVKKKRIGGSFKIICSELNPLGWQNSPVTGSRDSGAWPGFEGCWWYFLCEIRQVLYHPCTSFFLICKAE